MAVKRRVGLRIDPYQRARAVEKGRKQEAENGLGAVRTRRRSAKPATGELVFGSSQMAKKRRANSAARTSPISRP